MRQRAKQLVCFWLSYAVLGLVCLSMLTTKQQTNKPPTTTATKQLYILDMRSEGNFNELKIKKNKRILFVMNKLRAQELCESPGGCPGLPSLISPTVSVDVKQQFTTTRASCIAETAANMTCICGWKFAKWNRTKPRTPVQTQQTSEFWRRHMNTSIMCLWLTFKRLTLLISSVSLTEMHETVIKSYNVN